MLYIPQYWWHQVRSFHQPNIAVSLWFDVFNFQKEFEDRNILDVVNIVKVCGLNNVLYEAYIYVFVLI